MTAATKLESLKEVPEEASEIDLRTM